MDEAGAQEIEMPFGHRFDERDAAARARRLDERFDVRRTGGQAEPTAYALIEHIVRWNVGTRKAARRIDHAPHFGNA